MGFGFPGAMMEPDILLNKDFFLWNLVASHVLFIFIPPFARLYVLRGGASAELPPLTPHISIATGDTN